MKGRSFSRLLDELGGEEEGGDRVLGEPQRRVSADVGLSVTALGPKKNAAERKARWYGEIPEMPDAAQRLTLAELTGRIAEAASAEELRRLRREFARFNHPDTREDTPATAEMAAANRLIDDAIASMRGRCEG